MKNPARHLGPFVPRILTSSKRRIAGAKKAEYPLFLLGLICLPGCAMPWVRRAPDPAVRYIAFGDSATAGAAKRDYPEILRELLGVSEQSFVNEGRAGETTAEGLARLRTLLSEQLFPNADVLFYWEGGNDITDFVGEHDPFLLFSPDEPDYPYTDLLAESLADIQSNIEEAVSAAKDVGLDVYVATYYPTAPGVGGCDPVPFDILLPTQARRANAYVSLLNERVREAAFNRGATLVDVAESGDVILADPDNYLNCNHLSASGNAIVADIFLRSLQE